VDISITDENVVATHLQAPYHRSQLLIKWTMRWVHDAERVSVGMAPRLDLLGTGNAFLPRGRFHSMALVDGIHLIDASPTALASLRRSGRSPADLRSVLVTHTHGDHVFGFPFLLLERRYISDREGLHPLTVVGAPGVEERLRSLCALAYPGSLDELLDQVVFLTSPTGTLEGGWTYEMFEVLHDAATVPHGYTLRHVDGASVVHGGDTGPCAAFDGAVGGAALTIVEMGVPEWVHTEHHHRPSDVVALAERHPDVRFAVTHTFVDDDGPGPVTVTAEEPSMPANVHLSSDGDAWEWDGTAWAPLH
jgi:ribonuclease BN (tRNA processing enzyme)